AMDRGHYRDIQRRMKSTPSGQRPTRLYMFRQFDPEVAGDGVASVKEAPDVPDPYYGSERGFETVYQMVERTCARILDEIERGNLP
ncbi:MAG: hypothetical protein WCY01_08470, partial [Alkalispirochaeta sp.]